MDTRCEYSSLIIPNDTSYAPIAADYVGGIARKIGFDEQEAMQTGLGAKQAIANIIEYSFDPGEQATLEISCERVPVGLKIVIKDQGIPFDPDTFSEGIEKGEEGAESGIFGVKKYVDEVLFHSLGREGKETVLIKRLKNKGITDYYEACELEPYAAAQPQARPDLDKDDFIIRAMEPSEAAEVSKAIYKAYGYSYRYEFMYYPEQLAELNRDGRIHSAVAVTRDGEIAGHCALALWRSDARIAEVSQGVVKPEYRSKGLLIRLTQYLVGQARRMGLMGVYGQAVTNHTRSQRVGFALGLRDCGIALGFVPADVTFKGITENLAQRETLVIHFMYLTPPRSVTIFPPPHHAPMIEKLYQGFGVTPAIGIATHSEIESRPADSILNTLIIGPLNVGRIEIRTYGSNIVREIKARLKELCLKRLDVILLDLDLTDPNTGRFAGEFEALGFFFAGILPGAASQGDALILQYLNNVSIDYDQIQLNSNAGKELLAYIKEHDPNLV